MIKHVINTPKEDLPQSTFNSFDISNRIIVITGANKGNGLALASGLNNAGAKIIRIDLSFDSCIKPQRSKSPRDLFLQCYKETVYLTWRKANNK